MKRTVKTEISGLIGKLIRDSLVSLPKGTRVRLTEKYRKFATRFPQLSRNLGTEFTRPSLKFRHAIRTGIETAHKQGIIRRTERGVYERTGIATIN